jgi:hypothetical protein
MEKKIIFRDYQEQQAADHTNLQTFVQTSLDHIVADAVVDGNRYAGFDITQSATTEIQISSGRFYGTLGDVYNRDTVTTQSMLPFLPAVSKRYVLVTVGGSTVDTEVQERDFLVNVDTGQTEPDSVATQRVRQANISFVSGTESADPQLPATPANVAVIGWVRLNSSGIEAISNNTSYKVNSTEALHNRAKSLEAWKGIIGPRVDDLAGDIADLTKRLNSVGTNRGMIDIKKDLARVKEALGFPEGAAGYGADRFLDRTGSDYTNAATLGYDAKVMEGVRFPDANADQFEITLFSNNDPNAKVTNGILLPKFTDVVKVQHAHFNSALGIAQYGFQNHTMKEGYMSRMRLRHSDTLLTCENGWWYYSGEASPIGPQNLYDLDSWEISTLELSWVDPNDPSHYILREDGYWIDSWKEPFMYAQTTNHVINGAKIAQTFLASSDFWATKIGFAIAQKGGSGDIHVALCEVEDGAPNPSKTLAKVTYPHASIVTGWNDISINPTFLQKGKLYAVCLVSNANHQVWIGGGDEAPSKSYLQGTLFYSTDGQYYLGDLTQDMCFRVWGAQFAATQVTIEFQPINLDGGFRYIDILKHAWVPASTQLVFEVRPSGAGNWIPLNKQNKAALSASPALAQFRARFVGTTAMQPALKLTGSRVLVSRPKLAFRHVSSTLSCPSTTAITVEAKVEGFNDTPHDLTCRIRSGGIYVDPVSTVVKQISSRPVHMFTWTFNPAATTSFRIEFNGATNSAGSTFHISERVFYTT